MECALQDAENSGDQRGTLFDLSKCFIGPQHEVNRDIVGQLRAVERLLHLAEKSGIKREVQKCAMEAPGNVVAYHQGSRDTAGTL